MNGERWQRVEALFHAAMERSPQERAAFLKEACSDPDLRREVESLAGFDTGGELVLDQPAWERRLSKGEQLGPYQILEQVGSGGMGEVWKAKDTRLNRTVAIKVSREQFSSRFQCEANAIAGLNHPHICTLYDIGPNYLVLEYIEGTPVRGPLPLEKALQYGIQIADVLDHAHKMGIVHRDLKPDNILVTTTGVKVLDFGLAKMQQSVDLGKSETHTVTQEGMIVGTPQYMAPEQIEGKNADARTDIFVFGAVLYEMMTGRKAFQGETVADLKAAILEKDPLAGVEVTPPTLGLVLRACLAKDPQERCQNARDLKRELEWVSAVPEVAGRRKRAAPLKLWMAAIGVCAVVAAATLVTRLTKPAPQAIALNVAILPPDADTQFVSPLPLSYGEGGFALSPDGRFLAFVAQPKGKSPLLYVRALDSGTAKALPGTEGARAPFWSPDSRSIGFFTPNNLQRIDLDAVAPEVICNRGGQGGATWNRNGIILFAPTSGGVGLLRVPSTGGTPVPVTRPDEAKGEAWHSWPQFLPDGKHFLYSAKAGSEEASGVYVDTLEPNTSQPQRVLLVKSPYKAALSSSFSGGAGQLLFMTGGILMTQAFDPDTLRLSGRPTQLAADVGVNPTIGSADFSVAGNLLVYKPMVPRLGLATWRDRKGKVLGTVGDAVLYERISISPDGSRIAAERFYPQRDGVDIWLLETGRKSSTRITFMGWNGSPVWSPDGRQIAFAHLQNGIYLKAATGPGDPIQILSSSLYSFPNSWSRDGRFLLYRELTSTEGFDLWVLPLSNTGRAGGKPIPYIKTPFSERDGAFSPDGHWVAYTSDESGTEQVYVQSFSQPFGKWQISDTPGRFPQWRFDGRELFYFNIPARKLMAVRVNATGDRFLARKPEELFSLAPDRVNYLNYFSATGDGQRFLFIDPVPLSAVQPMTLIQNWQSKLQN